jgi:hypothetical protein
MQLIMQLKKDLKLTRGENDALRGMLQEISLGHPLDPNDPLAKGMELMLSRVSASANASRSPSASRFPAIL